jgi:hypothetical protein
MARRYQPNRRSRLVFLSMLGIWVVVAVAMQGRFAQDAVPFVAAGDLATTHPADVYRPHMTSLYDVSPQFATTSCNLAPPGTNCSDVVVGYVSTPQALPLSWVLGRLGPSLGVLAMRLLAAVSLAAGMLLLWQRLATRTRNAGTALTVTAVALTPMVMVPLSLGQNAPLLFLSACLGLSGTERGRKRAALVAVVWVATVSFKAFPAALVLVLLWQRRWKVLAWAAGAAASLAALTTLLGPASWYRDFLHASRAISGFAAANRFNGSIEAVVHGWSPALVGSSAFGPAYLVARLALVGGLWWWRVRHADADTQWAWAWVAVLLFVPLAWWHYLFVGLGAVALALAGRRKLTDRLLWWLPGMAVVSAVVSVPYIKDHPLPLVQALVLVACVAAVPLLVEAPRVSDPGPGASPAPPQPTLAGR